VEYGTATGPVDIIDMQAVKANMENPQFQATLQISYKNKNIFHDQEEEDT
jgi:hypothetical protein